VIERERETPIVSGLGDRITTVWTNFSLNQKVVLGTLLVATAMAGVFFSQQAQQDYDVLYANLSTPDAAATVAKLKDLKVNYKLADDGTTILVPRPQKNDLILETADSLSGDKTVNLAQIPPIVQGDVQKEWLRKYNTDAIAQVLRSIRGVKNAQVLVTQPEKSLFGDDGDNATASVMLIVDSGFKLQPEQAKTIKNLVAHAVPGLKPDHVELADNTGARLDDPTASPHTDADGKRKQLEDELTRKIVTVLSPVVGRENLVVSVSAHMNFDQTQSKIKRVIPMGGSETSPTGVLLSEQEQVEEYANKANAAGAGNGSGGGAPGTSSNIPSYQAKGAGAGNGQSSADAAENKGNNYRSTKRTTNYVNGEEERMTTYANGTVERVTVSVVLNKLLTSQETAELKDVVANAAGIDLTRGDAVDVKGFQFSQSPADVQKAATDAAKSAGDQAFMLQLATTLGGMLLGAGAMFMLYKLLNRPLMGELINPTVAASAMALPEGGGMALLPSDSIRRNLEATEAQPVFDNLDPDLEFKRNSISSFIEQEPAEAARFLMSFVRDDES
jgi:flagellar M-ring protein FliF